jgi:D-alanyl-D-alanine carboxypeptidase
MKRLLSFGFVVLIGAASANAQVSARLSARLNSAFENACKKNNIMGASVSAYIPNAGTWNKAFGESFAAHPITTDMVFQVNNNTKTIITALVMKARELGKLKLSDTIGTWISGYNNISGAITIEQLLYHKSGLSDYSYNQLYIKTVEQNFTKVWPHDGALQFVGYPYTAPGASYNFSNTDNVIAALVLEKVFKQPLAESLHQYILDPAGLKHTYLVPDEVVSDPIPHIWNYGMVSSSLIDFTSAFNYSDIEKQSLNFGSGNIISTAEDNAKFWHLLSSGQIVNDTSWVLMRKYVNTDTARAEGMSIFRYPNFNGHPAFGYGGSDIGYVNENITDSLTGISISVLTNQDSVNNNIILNELIRGLHKTILDSNLSGINFENPENTSSISIYPNPAVNEIRLSSTGSKKPVSVKIFDMSGRLQKIATINEDEAISVNDLAEGLYFVSINMAGVRAPVIVKFQVSR